MPMDAPTMLLVRNERMDCNSLAVCTGHGLLAAIQGTCDIAVTSAWWSIEELWTSWYCPCPCWPVCVLGCIWSLCCCLSATFSVVRHSCRCCKDSARLPRTSTLRCGSDLHSTTCLLRHCCLSRDDCHGVRRGPCLRELRHAARSSLKLTFVQMLVAPFRERLATDPHCPSIALPQRTPRPCLLCGRLAADQHRPCSMCLLLGVG
jgi:hypothetical protein